MAWNPSSMSVLLWAESLCRFSFFSLCFAFLLFFLAFMENEVCHERRSGTMLTDILRGSGEHLRAIPPSVLFQLFCLHWAQKFCMSRCNGRLRIWGLLGKFGFAFREYNIAGLCVHGVPTVNGYRQSWCSYQVDEEDRQYHNLCFEDHFSHGPIANIVKKCRSIKGCRDIYVNRVSSVIAMV